MSLERHPNFHAVKFVTDIMSVLYEQNPKATDILEESFRHCLRGKANPANAPDVSLQIRGFLYASASPPSKNQIVDFVSRIEDIVDRSVEH